MGKVVGRQFFDKLPNHVFPGRRREGVFFTRARRGPSKGSSIDRSAFPGMVNDSAEPAKLPAFDLTAFHWEIADEAARVQASYSAATITGSRVQNWRLGRSVSDHWPDHGFWIPCGGLGLFQNPIYHRQQSMLGSRIGTAVDR